MASGRWYVDERGRRCFRPAVPKLPEVADLYAELRAAEEAVSAFDRRLSEVRSSDALAAGSVGRLFARLDTVYSAGAEGSTATFTDIMEFDVSPRIPAHADDAAKVEAAADEFVRLEDGRDPVAAALAIHRRLFEGDPSPHRRVDAGHLKTSVNSTADRDQPEGIFFYAHPDQLGSALAEWEAFTMERDPSVPELVRQAASHWMFEHVHPLSDGNGRAGRLLVPLALRWKGATANGSAFFGEEVHENHDAYLAALRGARIDDDQTFWCRTMLGFVRRTAEANDGRLTRLLQTLADWSAATSHLRRDAVALRLLPWIATKPVFSVREAEAHAGVTFATANDAVRRLAEAGVVELRAAAARNRVFSAPAVLDIFDKVRRPSQKLSPDPRFAAAPTLRR